MNPSELEQCPICGGETFVYADGISSEDTGELFSVKVCCKCGHGETTPVPADLGPYYSHYHGGRHGFTARFRARRRAALLGRAFAGKDPRAVFDIGCGDGDFLIATRKMGWAVAGSERVEKASDIDGIRVFRDLAEAIEVLGESSQDAVTCWHSLEHFTDPNAALADIRRLLADNGVLIVAVPDSGGWQARIFGKSWLHLDVPRHLSHFTADSLKQVLEHHGFSVRRSRHCEFEYDVLGWSQSSLNAMFRTQNVFFHVLSGKAANVLIVSKLANFVLGSLLSAISLPLVLAGSLAGRGGTLVVEAVKFDNCTHISAK